MIPIYFNPLFSRQVSQIFLKSPMLYNFNWYYELSVNTQSFTSIKLIPTQLVFLSLAVPLFFYSISRLFVTLHLYEFFYITFSQKIQAKTISPQKKCLSQILHNPSQPIHIFLISVIFRSFQTSEKITLDTDTIILFALGCMDQNKSPIFVVLQKNRFTLRYQRSNSTGTCAQTNAVISENAKRERGKRHWESFSKD